MEPSNTPENNEAFRRGPLDRTENLSEGDSGNGTTISTMISWMVIVLCTLFLSGSVYFSQFLMDPEPSDTLPPQAGLQIRVALGVDDMGMENEALESLEDLNNTGPVTQRLGSVLAIAEVKGPEAAAKRLQENRELMAKFDYEPTEKEQALIDAVSRILEDRQHDVNASSDEAEPEGDATDATSQASQDDPSATPGDQTELQRTDAATGTVDNETLDTPESTADTPESAAAVVAEGAQQPSDQPNPDRLAPETVVARQGIDDGTLDSDLELVKEKLGIAGQVANGWYGLSDIPNRDLKSRLKVSMVGMIVVLFAIAIAVLVGLGLLTLLLVLVSSRKIHGLMQVPGTFSHLFLESFAVWIFCFVGFQLMLGLVTKVFNLQQTMENPTVSGFMNLLIFYGPMLLGLFWLIVRHPDPVAALKQAGFRSHGILSDMAHGLITYLAFLPLIGLAMTVTILLTTFVWGGHAEAHPFSPDRGPSHPINEQFGGSVWSLLYLYFLAAISAPIVEEIVFRGLLFRWLRDKTSLWGQSLKPESSPANLVWVSVLVSAVVNSFLFAAIHPQGLLGIPPLMMIGICMSYARNWRGGLIAPMTIHAIHNGSLVTLLAILNY